MFRIIKKDILAAEVKRIEVQAAVIAQKAAAGQFVIVIPDEKGERIPLTLSEWDVKKGMITLIFQEVGISTKKLGRLSVNDNIYGILGPLGRPTEIENYGTVVCIGAGVGIAEIYPVSRALKKANNEVIGIIGSRNKNLIILEDQMKQVCDQLYVTTDDGSCGTKGFVTEILKKIIQANKHIDIVYAIGPLVMMRAVSEITRPLKIKTIVSLNPIMVDGTGMCGSCRVMVGDETRFACVDGPDFDGHLVDFEELRIRMDLFKYQECNQKLCPNKEQA